MAGMVEVAQATVTIIPNMSGSQAAITTGLTGASTTAGTTAGKAAGSAMATSLGAGMVSVGGKLTKGVTLPLLAIATAAGTSWKKVDAGLDVIAQKTGATGSDLDALAAIMTNISNDVPAGFEDIGMAVGEINTRFGLTGDDLQDLSKQFVMFSDLNGTNVSDSIDDVQKAMAALNVDVDDASVFLDTLNAVGQSTGIDMGTLSKELVANSAVLNDLGMTASDAAFFVGTLDKSGVDSATALTAMKRAMVNAAAGGKTTSQALQDLQTKLSTTTDKTEAINAVAELFGTRAAPAMFEALSNGTISFETLGTSMDTFAGGVTTTFETTKSPLEEFQTTLNNLVVLGYQIAQAVMPVITEVMQIVTPIIQDLVTAWNNLDPGMQSFIVKALLVAMVAGPIISVLGGIFGAVGKVIGPIASLAGGLGGLAGKAGGAIGGLSGCATSLKTMAGQALLLVALGAAVLLVGVAMSILTDAAIKLADAGPPASLALLELAGVGVAMAAALALIGSVATVSALGLLALGAAVLLVAAGVALVVYTISILIDSFTTFALTLPVIASYGETAAASMTTISTALLGLAAACVAAGTACAGLGLTAATAFLAFSGAAVSIGATDLALVGIMTTASLAAAGLLVLGSTLGSIQSDLDDISTSASDAGASLDELVSTSEAIISAIDGVLESIGDFITDFINSIVGGTPDATAAGEDLGEGVSTGIETGLSDVESDTTTTMTAVSTAINNQASGFLTAGNNIGLSFCTGMTTGLSSLTSSVVSIMSSVTSAMLSSVYNLQAQIASVRFWFNSYIAVPHFWMSGSFNARTKSVPYVGVSWYKKAAEEGALFTDPTLIGVGDASQGEMLIGENTLFKMISEAVGGGKNITMNVYGAEGQNVNELATIIMNKIQHAVDQKGATFA